MQVAFLRIHGLAAIAALIAAACLAPGTAHGQIDPVERRLLHFGYNQPLEGQTPLSLYAFYLHNQTNFIRDDWTLRAALAPVWIDAQLGWRSLLGPHTDLALILAGGGYGRSYNELRLGEWEQGESFVGHGFTTGAAAFHLFNPDQKLPLSGILSMTLEGSVYDGDDDTDPSFKLPPDHLEPVLRAGLRLGGQEPDVRSPIALEVSLWYEARLRGDYGAYGFAGDRSLEEFSQLYWARILARYTTEERRQDAEFAFTLGGGSSVDRLSAYRLGGMLPYSSEFPLMIPGYYHQELSARQFILLTGNYSFAITPNSPWRAALFGATSSIDFVDGLEYPSHANSGVGGGLSWQSSRRSLAVSTFYGYGFDAVRGTRQGGQMVGIVLQYDFLHEGGSERFKVPRLSDDILHLFRH